VILPHHGVVAGKEWMHQPPPWITARLTDRRPSLLLHPIAIASIVVLVVNDHVLKALAPGFVTGKLSDVAGLVFFPLLIASLAEIVTGTGHRRVVLAGSITTTLLLFAVVKATSSGSEIFALGLGAAQWLVTLGPLRSAAGRGAGAGSGRRRPW
jgi:hypothetical protein